MYTNLTCYLFLLVISCLPVSDGECVDICPLLLKLIVSGHFILITYTNNIVKKDKGPENWIIITAV